MVGSRLTTRHLRQRLSVVLVRDNMHMLLSGAPKASPSQITGVCEHTVKFSCKQNINN